jgi:UDP-2,3-diacylglucosamine hydrolase
MTLPSKIGIVAGGGSLPQKVIQFCNTNHIEHFTVAIEGQADIERLRACGCPYQVMRIGEAGSIIAVFKERGYQDLVIIGSVKRPKLMQMKPDMRTVSFFARLGFKALGDDGLLKAVRAELEGDGFVLHAIQDFMPELLMPRGVIVGEPSLRHGEDVTIGLAASRKIGVEDIGQSVVVCDGTVIGTEDSSGTNALIKRCARQGAILVKSSKPQQDRKLDMPTIGRETITLCASLGYAGIAAEAGGVLVADYEEMKEAAQNAKMFWVGV